MMLSVFMDSKAIQKYVDLLESRIYFLKAKQKSTSVQDETKF